MLDILDKLIERLQPSSLQIIANYKTNSDEIKYQVYNSLSNARQLRYQKISSEIHRKIFHLKSQNAEFLKYLAVFEKELEALKSLKESYESKGNAKAYESKIKELEAEIEKLFAITEEVSFMDLYNDIESLHQQICDIKNKISEAKKEYQVYEDFPPNIELGKQKISLLKEKLTSQREKKNLF